MGKVVFEDPVHHISGKISKKFRTIYNLRKASQNKFTSVHGDRTAPASAAELEIRNKFKAVRQAVEARASDLSHLSQDQAAYKAARAAGDKHSTFRGWLFAQEWQKLA